ncbi:coat protein F [Aquibacillus halophilus]|uniref:Coat protein F n=1 Tax=Aquibacillus halophilus TaxID=930132 RepID=A0A6A8DFF8_9BACI|nr:coat protein F [Aquibacillus halophilus]MRH44445.1 coat protein F [Aquibacillus halophilus]
MSNHYQQLQFISPTGTLAPHEAIGLDELIAFKAVALTRLKDFVCEVRDPELRQLYFEAIQVMEKHIIETANMLNYRPILP